ncbi:methyl-accepting chemotaxis protein [Paenibacillus agricola]|uniref:Methyl-accepting chemotaxis protein n=1 Tax=Paenibacillus agricola TaxID=2716264 RepID=A0ABX0JG26_9BACL|nr:methyl-accepting chemotaxis protein [Paenibacillus agricola]NHN34488.1 methyl-accepting chemotaxis protein [Paenibacillus agricola]
MKNITIKNRLIFSFMVILLIPCSAIGFFSYQSAASEVAFQLENGAMQSVQLLNNQVTDLLSSSLTDMDYLAKQLTAEKVQDFESPQIRVVLEQYKALHPQFQMVFMGNKDGLMIRSPEQIVEGYDPRTREWYKAAMDNKAKAIINPASLSASSGTIVVVPSKSLNDGSGVVAGNLDLQKLAQTVATVRVGEKGYAFIVDKDKKYITHPTRKAGDVNNESFMEGFYEKESGTLNYTYLGEDKRSVFVTNPITGWKIIGAIELAEIDAASRGIFYTMVAVMIVSILLGGLLVFGIVRSITKPLDQLMAATDKIAQGDLTEVIVVRSLDEIGKLSVSVSNMAANLRGLISGVINSSHNVAAASQEISATTEEIAKGSTTQAEESQRMQELFSELTMVVNSVAASAENAAELAGRTTAIAKDGGEIVSKSIQSMNEVHLQMNLLEQDSNRIGEIINVISDIAGQTNLLALNAAIEAARAGDHGKGFAVVATEVRKLAERSGEATKQITDIIKSMQTNTHRSVVSVSAGVAQTEDTRKAFEQIIQMIDQTEQKVTEIAAASEEQMAQTSEVMNSIECIASASQQAAAASEETAATSQSLANLADDLNQSVSIFKINS